MIKEDESRSNNRNMAYQWLIVLLVILSLVGTVAWAMPTPLQRAQARLRKHAMHKGIHVRISKRQWPRERGAMSTDSYMAVGYGLLRPSGHGRKLVPDNRWEICRADGWHTKGLPKGWCWQYGEDNLPTKPLQRLTALLDNMPADVYAVASTPLAVMVYWHERATLEELDVLLGCLTTMVDEAL